MHGENIIEESNWEEFWCCKLGDWLNGIFPPPPAFFYHSKLCCALAWCTAPWHAANSASLFTFPELMDELKNQHESCATPFFHTTYTDPLSLIKWSDLTSNVQHSFISDFSRTFFLLFYHDPSFPKCSSRVRAASPPHCLPNLRMSFTECKAFIRLRTGKMIGSKANTSFDHRKLF